MLVCTFPGKVTTIRSTITPPVYALTGCSVGVYHRGTCNLRLGRPYITSVIFRFFVVACI